MHAYVYGGIYSLESGLFEIKLSRAEVGTDLLHRRLDGFPANFFHHICDTNKMTFGFLSGNVNQILALVCSVLFLHEDNYPLLEDFGHMHMLPNFVET